MMKMTSDEMSSKSASKVEGERTEAQNWSALSRLNND